MIRKITIIWKRGTISWELRYTLLFTNAIFLPCWKLRTITFFSRNSMIIRIESRIWLLRRRWEKKWRKNSVNSYRNNNKMKKINWLNYFKWRHWETKSFNSRIIRKYFTIFSKYLTSNMSLPNNKNKY